MNELNPADRRVLRARAHHLHPVVSIGQHGLTPQVLLEIDRALTAHELIKVRVFSDERDAREALMQQICAQAECHPVQHLGKLLILWRARPDEAKPPAKTRKSPRRATAATTKAPSKKPAGARRQPAANASSGGAARSTRPHVPRRARGQPPQVIDERAPARPPRAAKVPRGTPASPKPPRGKRRPASSEPAEAGVPRASKRVSAAKAPPAPGRVRRGGPAGVPRAPNPRRRRGQPG